MIDQPPQAGIYSHGLIGLGRDELKREIPVDMGPVGLQLEG